MLSLEKIEVKFYMPGDESGQLHKKQFDVWEEADEFIEGSGCEVFDHDYVRVDLPEDEIVFVNVYTVNRCYGGPEEGGWYYNWYECVEVFPVQNGQSDLMKKTLYDKYADTHKWGDIYSVLDGQDVAVYIEQHPKESETRERPHYE